MRINLFGSILALLFVLVAFTAQSQIVVNTNFQVNSNQPIDTRDTLTTLADTAFVTWTYPGLLAYVASEDDFWYYTGTQWRLLIDGTTIPASAPDSITVYAPSHGLTDTIALYGYVPVKADFTRANSSSADSVFVAYAIDAPDADSLILIFSGVLTYGSWHGKEIDVQYYLQDDGSEDITSGTVSMPTAIASDSTTLFLREVGVDIAGRLRRIAMPSPLITAFGGNPASPTDTVVQLAISTLYLPAGLAQPGTIFTLSYPTQSYNPTYQQVLPNTNPLTPSYAWLWDGALATRIVNIPTSVNLQDTNYGVLGTLVLLPIDSLGSLPPTDSLVAIWLNTNYTVNNLRIANGSLLYYIGDGTRQSPDYIWQVIDDISYDASDTDWEKIIKKINQPGGSGGATPAIRNDLPNESILIDPNNNDLKIGTAALNNSGEFEFYALTADAEVQDVIIYAGSRDSSSLVTGEGFAFNVAIGAVGQEDGIIGVNYEYFGTVFNTAMFGDSMLVSSYPGSELTYILEDLPRSPADTTSAVLVQNWSTKKVYTRNAATIDKDFAANGLTMSGDSTILGGTLNRNTTITGGAYGLTLSRSSGGNTLTVNNTAGGAAVFGNTTTGYGLSGYASNNGVGVQAWSSGNSGIPLDVQGSSTLASTARSMINIVNQTSSTPLANFGSDITSILTGSDGLTYTAGVLRNKWTNPLVANRSASWEFHLVNNAVSSRKLALLSTGQLTLDGYANNALNNPDSSLYVMAVDATGDVHTRAASGLGGDGNGIIDALPAGPVVVDADGNPLIIGQSIVVITTDSLAYAVAGDPGAIPGDVIYGFLSSAIDAYSVFYGDASGIFVLNGSETAYIAPKYNAANDAVRAEIKWKSASDSTQIIADEKGISLTADTLDATNVTTFLGFPSGSDGNGIIDSLPNGSITIDPNNYDLQIGTKAANNTGEFEVVTLTPDGRDAILYVGAADSTSAPIPAEGVLMSHVSGGEVGGVAVNYEYLGDIYNAVIFGDSILISKWAGDTTQLFIAQLPITGSSGKYLLAEDPATNRIGRVDASTLGGTATVDTFSLSGNTLSLSLTGDAQPAKTVNLTVYDKTLSASRDTLTISDGNSIRTPGTGFLRDSITGATLTIDLKKYSNAVVVVKMESATNCTLTVNNPWSVLTDNTAPTYEGQTGVYSFHFLGTSGTDNITWPSAFLDMGGTQLGTDAITAGTVYTCYYDPVGAKYFCK